MNIRPNSHHPSLASPYSHWFLSYRKPQLVVSLHLSLPSLLINYDNSYQLIIWLVVWNIFYFPLHIFYGMPSFPLTNSIIFQDGHIAPPTSTGSSSFFRGVGLNHQPVHHVLTLVKHTVFVVAKSWLNHLGNPWKGWLKAQENHGMFTMFTTVFNW